MGGLSSRAISGVLVSSNRHQKRLQLTRHALHICLREGRGHLQLDCPVLFGEREEVARGYQVLELGPTDWAGIR